MGSEPMLAVAEDDVAGAAEAAETGSVNCEPVSRPIGAEPELAEAIALNRCRASGASTPSAFSKRAASEVRGLKPAPRCLPISSASPDSAVTPPTDHCAKIVAVLLPGKANGRYAFRGVRFRRERVADERRYNACRL